MKAVRRSWYRWDPNSGAESMQFNEKGDLILEVQERWTAYIPLRHVIGIYKHMQAGKSFETYGAMKVDRDVGAYILANFPELGIDIR